MEEALEDLPPPAPATSGIARSEQQVLLDTLQSVRGNREQAARLLQISTTTLWRRMKKYQEADPEAFAATRLYGPLESSVKG